MRGEERRGSQEAPARFSRRLADLKRNGCNILLAGTDAMETACERLLGESSAGPRYRLFVTTDARPPTAQAKLASVQSGPYSDDAAVVNWQGDVRGAVATDGADRGDAVAGDVGHRDSGTPSFRQRTVESDDLHELGRTIEETVGSFETAAGGFSPAELRLCVDSLTPLVADYERKDVHRFLVGLTETVEREDGMAHYHLPAEYDSETVESLAPLFDAVVEVRRADGGTQQRWHLRDPEVTTDWIPL